MDFFAHQDRRRRLSTLLLLCFAGAVVAVCLVIYVSVVLLMRWQNFEQSFAGPLAWWSPPVFLWTMAIVGSVVLIGAVYMRQKLGQGGPGVALIMGGHLLDESPSALKDRQLLNVVEEVAIASGMPVPIIFVLRDQYGINAFASGVDIADAAITVTQGALDHLSRDELQSVIAHEFSHIRNGDMNLNVNMAAALFGLSMINAIGRWLSVGHRRVSRGRGSGQFVVFGVILRLIGWIGVLGGKVIKSAFSRQREFLADASAVQFTRQPRALMKVLQKIHGLDVGSGVSHVHAETFSHLFFANAMSTKWPRLLSTHPNIVDRIRMIDPLFKGGFPKLRAPVRDQAPEQKKDEASGLKRTPLERIAMGAMLLSYQDNPLFEHLMYAQELHAKIPEDLLQLVHSSQQASLVLYALLMDRNDDVATMQSEFIRTSIGERELDRVQLFNRQIEQSGIEARLLFIDLLMPALRKLPQEQRDQIVLVVEQLVSADNKIKPFEFAVEAAIRRALQPQEGFQAARYHTFKSVCPSLDLVLSLLAYTGQSSMVDIKRALGLAANILGLDHVALVDRREVSLAQVKPALGVLNQMTDVLKRRFLEACAVAIAADGTISLRESEVVRGIAESLGCALPPVINPERIQENIS